MDVPKFENCEVESETIQRIKVVGPRDLGSKVLNELIELGFHCTRVGPRLGTIKGAKPEFLFIAER